jgi:membrane protease YdiL (CAAX protease family)
LLANLPSVVPVFIAMLLFPLSGAFGEELGWRGFALPRLLEGRSPLSATLLLGVLVAAWHAPLFVAGIYRPAGLQFLVIVTTTALFVLLYLKTNGSVLLAMVLHATMNGAPESFSRLSRGPIERGRCSCSWWVSFCWPAS